MYTLSETIYGIYNLRDIGIGCSLKVEGLVARITVIGGNEFLLLTLLKLCFQKIKTETERQTTST